jgi:hypothetical protein
MVNPELLNYVRGQLGAGISRDQIKKALATGGWSDQDASDAFNVIDGVRLPPSVPPPPPPTNIGVNPAYQAPGVSSPTYQAPPAMQPGVSMGARPPLSSSVSMSKRRSFPWTPIIVLVIVALVGFAFYMAFPWVQAQYNAYSSVFNGQPTPNDMTPSDETPTDTDQTPAASSNTATGTITTFTTTNTLLK